DPAPSLEEYLGPGMRVRLAHGEDAVDGVEVTALVAHHHACRHASGAHQERERGSEVLAEAFLGLEKELVHRVLAEERRLERVLVASGAHEVDGASQYLRIGR